MTDSVWMTKEELAAAHRISIGSANRLISHRRWKRQSGDDGRTRILVPRRWAKGRPSMDTAATDAPMKANSEVSTACDRGAGIVHVLREEVVSLRVELETEKSARRKAELERDQARLAQKTAEHALSETRQQAEQAIQTAEALRKAKESRAAEDRAEQVTREAAAAQLRHLTEAMAARRSLNLWGRLQLAWRGE